MSLKEYATFKIKRDTAANWTLNNPTPLEGEWCLETDTGNIKLGDGSTAWNDLGYRQSLPFTHDLTSANITHTLPPITGAPQTESIYWTDGGTYKLTLAVTDGATVGGETAGTWEGEVNGHILVESDGSNWQVREYEDSGSSSDGEWEKYKNGKLECVDSIASTSIASTTGSGNIFVSGSLSARVFPHGFVNIDYVNISVDSASSSVGAWIVTDSAAGTTLTAWPAYRVADSISGTTNITRRFIAIGRWRT